MAPRNPWAPIDWFPVAIPLWPGHSRIMVHGVGADADLALRNWWKQLARAAATPAKGDEG
jgi:hypothetical protein